MPLGKLLGSWSINIVAANWGPFITPPKPVATFQSSLQCRITQTPPPKPGAKEGAWHYRIVGTSSSMNVSGHWIHSGIVSSQLAAMNHEDCRFNITNELEMEEILELPRWRFLFHSLNGPPGFPKSIENRIKNGYCIWST